MRPSSRTRGCRADSPGEAAPLFSCGSLHAAHFYGVRGDKKRAAHVERQLTTHEWTRGHGARTAAWPKRHNTRTIPPCRSYHNRPICDVEPGLRDLWIVVSC